jgi:predicted NAD-dependent protein-ADP-ribosyltransferase YbiA (DUF1768 family)
METCSAIRKVDLMRCQHKVKDNGRCGIHKIRSKTSNKKTPIKVNKPSEVDVLMFFSKSKDVKPGEGKGEHVSNPKMYTELSKIKDWRKILSNFHICEFKYKNLTYRTIEHAFQAEKIALVDKKLAYTFAVESDTPLGLGDGNDARKARKIIKLDEESLQRWNSIKNDIMTNISIEKYKMCEEALNVLKLTNNSQLWHIVMRSSSQEHFVHLEQIRDKSKTKPKIKKTEFIPRIALTFSYGMIENGVRMQQLGELEKRGYTVSELKVMEEKFIKLGATCELINLNDMLPERDTKYNTDDAAILIIRNGISVLGSDPDDLLEEQMSLNWDVKKLNRGNISNSVARRNLCYADFSQENNYADFDGKVPKDAEVRGTVIDFESIIFTKMLRESIVDLIPKYKEVDGGRVLLGEGNLYYDNKSYIGYHGDSERKTVICCCLGSSTNLNYQWYMRRECIGSTLSLEINHGDIYIMSEKATGNDWKKHANNLCTLRHAAGNVKLKN